MIDCYLKLVRDTSPKKGGAERKTPTYVVTEQAGYFKPLQTITNPKGEIVMYWQNNDVCNPNSKSETRLQCSYKGSVNFSSIYMKQLKIGETLIGYGNPPVTKELKNGKKGTKPNPFYENKEDGYLFLIAPDLQTLEILVVPKAGNIISGIAKQLADGQLNEALQQIRNTAKPM
ncbi:MAG: hypothetical protein LBE82_11510 [Chitinophagaceae bacterium]|jgi:hypothetical protein|nr:hypothetical protein [Chitinophagaceae bacterium]